MFFSVLLNLQDTNKWYRFFRSSYLFLFLFFIYCPWLFVVALSFMKASDKNVTDMSFSSGWSGITNYHKFFTDNVFYGNFWEGFVNSLLIVILTVSISLFVGISTAISIWVNNEKNKKSTFALSNISIGTPDIIQGITFFALFSAFLLPLGVPFGLLTVVIAHVAISIPYVIVFIYPKLSKISHNMVLASYDLKYSSRETIFKVLIPMLMPSIFLSIFLVFSLSFDDFIITNLVRGNLTTITSMMYTMKRGIKTWVIVFGALMFWVSISIVLIKSFYNIFSSSSSFGAGVKSKLTPVTKNQDK